MHFDQKATAQTASFYKKEIAQFRSLSEMDFGERKINAF